MEIDLSTQQISESVHYSLRNIVSLEEVLKLWHTLGLVVREQLIQKKGVRLEKLGYFGFDVMGCPCFNVANEFMRTYKVRHVPTPTSDNIPISKLNFTQLSRMCGVDRSRAEKIYAKYVELFGAGVRTGQNALLSIHRVAEVFVNNDSVKCSFLPEFVDMMSTKSKVANRKRPSSAPRTRVNPRDTINAASSPSVPVRSHGAVVRGKRNDVVKKNVVRGKKRIEAPGNFHGHNPIVGDDDDDDNFENISRPNVNRGKKAVAGGANQRHRNPILEGDDYVSIASSDQGFGYSPRPMSAGSRSTTSRASSASTHSIDTNSLLHSPRGRIPDGRRGVSRGTGGLRKETLARHNSSAPRGTRKEAAPAVRPSTPASSVAVDARALAARAMGPGDIVEKIKQKIVARGGVNGIKGFARLLKIMDDNGDKRLTKDELMYGMRDYGINLTKTEVEQLFLLFDRDRNGFIDIDEFLIGIRGDLNDRRKKLVRMAFDILDTDGSGLITVDELSAVYDVSWNPAVQAGKMTEAEAMKEFMRQWDRLDGDGMVSIEEFEDYYKGVSSSIDGDDYFELMIRNAWRIPGGEGMAANTANKRVLVTNKDGSQSIATVHNELGMKPGDRDAVRSRLAQQGIDAANVELHGGIDTTEKPKKNRRGDVRREAWSEPGGGDHSAPPERHFRGDQRSSGPGRSDRREGGNRLEASSSAQTGTTVNISEILRQCLYNPPLSLEQLAMKLKISLVGENPQISRAVFCQRISQIAPETDKRTLAHIWESVAESCAGKKTAPSIGINDLHKYFCNKYGKDKSSKSHSVVDRAIAKIIERSGGGFKGLQRTLSIMDDNGDKRLNKEELKNGLSDYGINLNHREIDDIFLVFDRDHNGFIDVDEFLIGIRGDLNDRRKKLVRMAFDILDTDGSGLITVDELSAVYDVSWNPAVQAGKMTEAEAMKEFMRQWDRLDGDGMVSIEEFEDYYKGVSSSIDGDDYFELMIRNAWRIPGGEGMAANTANKRVLVTNKDGSQSIATVHNELGMKPGDRDAVRSRLAQQGIDAANVELHGGIDTTEKPKKTRQDSSNQQNIAPKHIRHRAAEKLGAAFRGHKGRKEVSKVRSNVEAAMRREQDREEEIRKEKARHIYRPKGKSYIGF
mmetsp:Transcript_9325/g.14050  ORF Transcript_9325/g.14050 Transcript_9325/m.14050 type:complete len:1135 (+) Transcript_9325:93-3497(+)